MREKFIAKHVEVQIILRVNVILGTRFVSNVLRQGIRLLLCIEREIIRGLKR